ncbi:MAG: RimK family alpha-L-glutamate ligase [Bacilli bacterium]
MKALIIINSFSDNPNNSHKARRIKEELSNRGIDCDIKKAVSFLPSTNGNQISFPNLSDYSFAIDLDKDSYLADALDEKLPLFNSAKSLHLSDDKMTTILALKGQGIITPLTIPAPLCYVSNPPQEEISEFLNQVEAQLSYPLVFKENHGSMGRQVKLIRNRSELEENYYSHISVPHLYEEFLSKHQGHDYRVMVIGSKVVAVMERVNLNDFRSNIALGGKGYDATDTLPESFKKVAIKACKILDLDYAGIDIAMSDNDSPIFIEANGNAFFTEIEKVTGVNITSLLINNILEKISK